MSAVIEPTAATGSADDPKEPVLDDFEDPEHPSFWIAKFKPNPNYEGPADLALNKNSEGPDRHGNTKMIRYYFHAKSQQKMPYKPNFYTWKKARRYAEKSCCCLTAQNKCRQALVKLVTSTPFETFILLVVFLNTIFLMCSDYNYNTVNVESYIPFALEEDGCCNFMKPMPPVCKNTTAPDSPCRAQSCYTAQADKTGNICCECPSINMVVGSVEAEWIFLIIFLIEMVLKMVAFGVCYGSAKQYGAYFTDGWNLLDFVIVMAALVAVPIPGVDMSALPSLTFLRVIRVLRPLRSLSFIPKMRRMVQTLLMSITQLLAVLMLLSFIFLIFGALMIQIYAGELRYTCRLTNFPLQLPVMSLSSPEYKTNCEGFAPSCSEITEVNWCTHHDNWDQTTRTIWGTFFPTCNANDNTFANTRTSTMNDKVFYHKLREYPGPVDLKGKQTYITKYFFFERSKNWHRFHLQLMLNASALAGTNDIYAQAAINYEGDVKGAKEVFKPCHDEDGITIPISFEQCNRICYDQTVDANGLRTNPCDQNEKSGRCKIWKNRQFDVHNKAHPMCSKYCPDKAKGENWDIHNLKTPQSMLLSPWRNTTRASFPFYNDHKHCFWPNDNGEHEARTANRYCSGWFGATYDDAAGFNKCPATQYCGSDFDATGHLRFHGFDIVNTAIYKEDLLWGIPQFNNFPEAFLSIFQTITQEGWVDITYTVADRLSFGGAIVMFVATVFVGGIFLLNMTLAVISDSFANQRDKEEEKEEKIKLIKMKDDREMERMEAMKERPMGCVQKTCLCCGTKRSHEFSENCCLRNMYSFVALSPAFDLLILICIIINFLTLCLEFYRCPYSVILVLDWINFFLTIIFFVEMVLKLIGLGLRDYFKNNWNLFDFLIVISSVIEYSLSPPLFTGMTSTIGDVNLKVLRTFRVFRVFKLAKGWQHLRRVLAILAKSLQDVFYFFILLSIFILIFAVWGLQLFSNRFRFDLVTNRPVPLELDPATNMPSQAFLDADVPDANFDGLFPAILTVFQICTGENWNAVMYDGMRSTGWEAFFFFFLMIFVLVMIVLELFVAILLGQFDALGAIDEQEEDEEDKVDRCCCCFLIGPKQDEPDALGSMCKKKGGVVAPAGDVELEAEPEGLSIDRLLAVDGPLKRWLNSCKQGMDQHIVHFYRRGVKKVADFQKITDEVLQDMLTQDEVEAFKARVEQPAPKGIDTTAFEEVTMLEMGRLTDEKCKNQKILKTKKAEMEEHKAAGDELPLPELREYNYIVTDTEKKLKSISKDLSQLEAKLTPDEKALFCIPRNKCRITLNYIVEFPSFDSLILVAIVISTILLMVETPMMLKTGHWINTFFTVCNWIFAWIFIVEMVFKILAKGFVLHKNAYLRNSWNVLDFLIVMVSIVLMTMDILTWSGFELGSNFLGALRALRAMRALRPLRSVRRLPELRVIVLALLGSFPFVMQTLLVVVIFFTVFSVMGVGFYKGGFKYCEFSGLPDATEAMMELEQCNPDGQELDDPICTLWTELTSVQRVDYMAASSNEFDKKFTTEYNSALLKGLQTFNWKDWNSPEACKLSLYISNSMNWTGTGPECSMKMTGERLFGEYTVKYKLKENVPAYLKPTSKTICDWMGGTWDLYEGVPQSFDNVLIGLMSWFELSTTEGWVDVMYAAAAYRGVDMEPISADTYDYTSNDFFARYVTSTLLFVFFIIFGTFLLMNMFVGTVCSVFQQMRQNNDNQAVFLTDSQKEWQRRQKTIISLQPFLKPRAPDNACRSKVFNAATSGGFETFIFLCITANTLIMMARFFPTLIPQHWVVGFATEIANIVFAVIFTFEAVFKIAGMGQQYFCKKDCRSKKRDAKGNERTSCTCAYADYWNLFDFIIVIGTIFGLFIKYSVGLSGINAITTLIRTFRVARIFRLVKHPYLKKLKLLLTTIGLSLPSILNLAVVLLLFLAIFAILGVQLFATVAHNDALNDHANFQSFGLALLTMFRGTTGENWNGIMHSLSRSAENCNPNGVLYNASMCGFCEWEQIYIEGGDPLNCIDCIPIDGCGQPIYSEVFFMLFTFIVTYMVMNIFVAVILEAYEQSSLDEMAIVTADDLANFKAQWAVFDTDADMAIPLVSLPEFMDALAFPMGFKEPEIKVLEQKEFLPEAYEETNRCVISTPNLDHDETDENGNLGLVMQELNQNQKQKQIDDMEIHSYHVNGVAQVQFRDVLFACVQRAYKKGDPATAFKIDTNHKEALEDQTKTMAAVPIKTSHYLSALRIAQAYRAHKFRNHFRIGMQIENAESEQKYADSNKKRNTRKAFAADEEKTDEETAED